MAVETDGIKFQCDRPFCSIASENKVLTGISETLLKIREINIYEVICNILKLSFSVFMTGLKYVGDLFLLLSISNMISKYFNFPFGLIVVFSYERTFNFMSLFPCILKK